jgi:hypothetical protein
MNETRVRIDCYFLRILASSLEGSFFAAMTYGATGSLQGSLFVWGFVSAFSTVYDAISKSGSL